MESGFSKVASPFSSRPKVFGAGLLLASLAGVAVTVLVPAGELRTWARIGAAALALVGVFSYAFGMLIQAASKPPQGNGPVA